MNTSVKTLLVVEDEDSQRENIQFFVATTFPEVQTFVAADGAQALRAITENDRIDVVFTDMGYKNSKGEYLPDAGVEVLEFARKKFPDIHCIAISANLTDRAKSYCALNGIPLLEKPVRPLPLLSQALGIPPMPFKTSVPDRSKRPSSVE